MSVIAMTDLDLSNKRVLIREDLNVPVKDGKVASDARLKAAIPSIKAALDGGAKVAMLDLRKAKGAFVSYLWRRARGGEAAFGPPLE